MPKAPTKSKITTTTLLVCVATGIVSGILRMEHFETSEIIWLNALTGFIFSISLMVSHLYIYGPRKEKEALLGYLAIILLGTASYFISVFVVYYFQDLKIMEGVTNRVFTLFVLGGAVGSLLSSGVLYLSYVITLSVHSPKKLAYILLLGFVSGAAFIGVHFLPYMPDTPFNGRYVFCSIMSYAIWQIAIGMYLNHLKPNPKLFDYRLKPKAANVDLNTQSNAS